MERAARLLTLRRGTAIPQILELPTPIPPPDSVRLGESLDVLSGEPQGFKEVDLSWMEPSIDDAIQVEGRCLGWKLDEDRFIGWNPPSRNPDEWTVARRSHRELLLRGALVVTKNLCRLLLRGAE